MDGVLHLSSAFPAGPSRRSAVLALALFVAVQIADGVLTSIGIARFGLGIEANPLLAHTMLAFGTGTTLVAAKTIAIVGGALLHLNSYHLAVAALTVGYVFVTLLPWAILLA
jgi:hypothetical protein